MLCEGERRTPHKAPSTPKLKRLAYWLALAFSGRDRGGAAEKGRFARRPKVFPAERLRALGQVLAFSGGLGFISSLHAETVDVVGSLPGEFVVNSLGQANYTIPIAVPPGTAGMEPELSFVFNSNGSNGLLGVGWSIGGLSTITRGGKTLLHDDVLEGVQWNNTDPFYLDGQRLVLVDGEHGEAGSEYRTEIESFIRIRLLVNPNSSDDLYFKIETKDGLVMTYGSSADSMVRLGSSARRPYTWALESIRDTVGNWIDFKYANGADQSINDNYSYAIEEHYIKQVSYGSSGLTKALASIDFEYEDRSDSVEAVKMYISGEELSLTKRLKEVTVNTGDSDLIRKYHIAYEYGPTSKLSRVVSIQQEAADSVFLPKTIFETKSESGDHFADDYLPSPSQRFGPWEDSDPEDDDNRFPTNSFSDFDRDGRSDLVRFYEGDGGIKYSYNLSRNLHSSTDGETFLENLDISNIVPDFSLFNIYPDTFPDPFDSNGMEFPPYITSDFISLEWSSGPVSFVEYSLNGSGFYEADTAQVFVGDPDGDGESEVIVIGLYDYCRFNFTLKMNDDYEGLPDYEIPGVNFGMCKYTENDNDGDGDMDEISVEYQVYARIARVFEVNFSEESIQFSESVALRSVLGSLVSECDLADAYEGIRKDRYTALDLDGDAKDEIIQLGISGQKDEILQFRIFAQAIGSQNAKYKIEGEIEQDENNKELAGFYSGDFNGDGKPDYAIRYSDRSKKDILTFFVNDSSDSDISFERSKIPDLDLGSFNPDSSSSVLPRLTSADINGDGLTDFYHTSYTKDGVDYDANVKTVLSTGRGWDLSGYGDELSYTIAHGEHQLGLGEDLNGDGRGDYCLLYPIGDKLGVKVWTSTGKGPKLTEPDIYEKTFIPYANQSGGWQVSFNDVDGNGRVDLRILVEDEGSENETAAFILKGPGGSIDQIEKIKEGARDSDGDGEADEFESTLGLEFLPLTDEEVYLRGTGAHYPIQEVISPLHVVSAVRRNVGLDPETVIGTYFTYYTYANARAHVLGKGFLGFQIFESYDPHRELSKIQVLAQDFPYTGMVLRTENTFWPDSIDSREMISQTDNTLFANRVDDSAGGGKNDGETIFPMIVKSVQRSWQPDGNGTNDDDPWSVVITRNLFDDLYSEHSLNPVEYVDGLEDASDGSSEAIVLKSNEIPPYGLPVPGYTPRWSELERPTGTVLEFQAALDDGSSRKSIGDWSTDIAVLESNISSGNLRWVQVQYGDEGSTAKDFSTTTTVNTFSDSVTHEKWHLGRLTETSVTHNQPNGGIDESALNDLPNSVVDSLSVTRTSSFRYDSTSGLLSSETIEPDDPNHEVVTSYVRDEFGNITSTTVVPVGMDARTTTTEYDSDGRFAIATMNAVGHRETYVYDSALGVLLEQTGPNGITTKWTYDTFGRQATEVTNFGTEIEQVVSTTRYYDSTVIPNRTANGSNLGSRVAYTRIETTAPKSPST